MIDLLLVGLEENIGSEERQEELRGGVRLNSNERSIALQQKEVVWFRV
jgi:hypothetical protein